MNRWRPNLYNSRGIAPEDQELAAKRFRKAGGTTVTLSANDQDHKAAQSRITAREKELRDAAEKEVKARIRSQGATSPGRSQSLNGAGIKQDNIPAAAKARGMTPDEFTKAWTAAGGVILPSTLNASLLPELLKRARLEDPRLTMNEWRKRLGAHKVIINEDR
jgi:hypothetical protein